MKKKIILNNELVAPRTKLLEGANPNKKESYTLFEQVEYAPELMAKKALKFIETRKTDQPFFLYYASPLIHNLLQAPKKMGSILSGETRNEEPYLGDIDISHRNT